MVQTAINIIMSTLNTRRSIPCPYCRYGNVQGRTTEVERKEKSVIVEHRWVCPQCQQLARAQREEVAK